MQDLLAYKAYFVADQINVKEYRQAYRKDLVSANSLALYYQIDDSQYLFMLHYGVVVFCNVPEVIATTYLTDIKAYSTQWNQEAASDDFVVALKPEGGVEVGFGTLSVGRFDHEVNKMIMLHLAQSVALDHYNTLSQTNLSEVKEHTEFMRLHGNVKLGQKQALKFIGKSLATKNSIAENLYILDAPATAWEDEYLDQLHKKLSNHFELAQRYRAIENTLKIIDDNLSVYLTYNHHRESSRLEWIIIILIVIEVVDTFVSKLF